MQVRILALLLLVFAPAIAINAQVQGTVTLSDGGQGTVVFSGGMVMSQPSAPPSPDASASDPSKTATLSGTVFSASTGAPLRKARISLHMSGEKVPPRAAITDDGGHFSIDAISPGRYDLSAGHSGYVQQEYGQDKPGKAPEMLALAAGQKIDDIAFHLQQAAVITGHVYDEDGDPIQNANVQVTRMSYVRGKRQLMGVQGGSTDDKGEYRIFDLEPGHYYVRASYGGDGFMFSPLEGDLTYPPVFYPNAASADRASPIDLKAGDEIPGVDFQLTPESTPGYQVSGKVLGAGKTGPMSMVMLVQKTPDEDVGGFNTRQTMSNPADGTFRFSNIAPGTYTLRAMQNENGQAKVAAQDIVVGDANVTNVTLVETPGITITGHLTFEGKASAAGPVNVAISQASGEGFLGGANAQVDPDGSFTLKNVTDGTYSLQVWSGCDTCYLKSASSRGADLLGSSFDVQGGAAPSQIEIVYSGNTAEASGTVNGDDNKPAGGAVVIAAPVADTPNRDARYKTSTTDQYGHFDLQALAPGDYDIIALTGFDENTQEYMDPDFMQPYAQKAERLSVAEGDHKTLDLDAIAVDANSQ